MSRLRATALALALVAAALAGPIPSHAAPVAKPYVVSDVRAGRDLMQAQNADQQPDTTVEPSIAVDPTDPDVAVTVYQEGRIDDGGDEANGFAATSDGGRTWTFGELPGVTTAVGGQWDRASDPVVAFGPDGTAYAASLVFDDSPSSPSGVAVNVSTDGGVTWSAPTFPANDATNDDDKEWLVVDQSADPGHHQGRVYAVWDHANGGIFLSYSDDTAATWSAPSVVTANQGVGAIPLVLPNGDLAVVYETFGSGDGGPGAAWDRQEAPRETVAGLHMNMVTATGAGAIAGGAPIPFGSPSAIDDYRGNVIRQQRAGALPTAAVDPTRGQNGRIYVGWEDGRFRHDKANDAVVTWSDDGGSTWHALKRVNPGPRGDWVDRYNTTIAVGPDGSLRVAYLARQEARSMSQASPYVDVYYQRSLDGGRTFSAPLRINVNRRADIRFAAFSRGGAFFGDYDQLAVAGSLTYVATCRAYRLHKGERATFPPTVQHQRTWVTVVGGG